MKKTAFITGITGQDGSYLAELLLEKGYLVHGLARPSSTNNLQHIEHLNIIRTTDSDVNFENKKNTIYIHYGNLDDSNRLSKIVNQIRPDEIYNLGAVSNVQTSFEMPEYTGNITALGPIRVLNAMREHKLTQCKFYQASSSEMFGKVKVSPQNEETPFNPVSPYGVSKVYAHEMAKTYRSAYNMFICSGILFNHESHRRGLNFVTRKITNGIARIMSGKQKYIVLGNLKAKRDWGYAPEYVNAMWLILQEKKPEDYVIATGETHSVLEFIESAFATVNLNWQKFIKIDKKYTRPCEVDYLLGDYKKAKQSLGWEPKITFKELVKIMVSADLMKEGIIKKLPVPNNNGRGRTHRKLIASGKSTDKMRTLD